MIVFQKFLTVEFNVVSSAYKMKSNFLLDLIMSLIKILNNKGPTIEPWGTPVLNDCMDDLTSSIFTYCFLSDR